MLAYRLRGHVFEKSLNVDGGDFLAVCFALTCLVWAALSMMISCGHSGQSCRFIVVQFCGLNVWCVVVR